MTDEVLGQGTHAVVKRALRKGEGGSAVAVKEVRTLRDEELCAVIRKEFEILKSLKHPSITEVYDLFFSSDLSKAWLCMELVRGHTLQMLVETQNAIPEVTMSPLFEQLTSAVCYLHTKRIVHRDLKPDNLLVSDGLGRLRICDFNCARQIASGAMLTNRSGTLLFAAPEMLSGGRIFGEQVDIWAIGMCLYFALAGNEKFMSQVGRRAKNPKAYNLFLCNREWHMEWIKCLELPKNAPVVEVLWGCWNPDPSKRPEAILLLSHPWVCQASQYSPVRAVRKRVQRMCRYDLFLYHTHPGEMLSFPISPLAGGSPPWCPRIGSTFCLMQRADMDRLCDLQDEDAGSVRLKHGTFH
jgi:serine/threonine protein kinase